MSSALPPDPPAPASSFSGAPAGVKGLSRRARIGRVMDAMGLLGAPLFVGAVGGFWAADFGVRWLPDMMAFVTTGCALSLVLFIAGKWFRGPAHLLTPEGLRVRRRVIVAFVVVMLAGLGRLAVHATQQPTPLTSLPESQREEAFRIDLQRLRDIERGLEQVTRDIEALLPEDLDESVVLSADQELALRTGWRAVFEQAQALDQVREFYEDWYRLDPSRSGRPDHLRAFLIAFSAELALFEKGSRVTRAVMRSENARKLLDSPSEEWRLPADSFSRFRQELQGMRDQGRIVAGERYLDVLNAAFDAHEEAERIGAAALWDTVRLQAAAVEHLGLVNRAEMSAMGDLEILRRSVHHAWYPAQKGVAEAMGDVRLRRVGWYLIPPERQAEMDALMQPGDIVVARKNWYLSNVGLPGFWPHGLIYLGDPRKFEAYFDDEDVRAWVAERSGTEQSLGEWMEERFPRDWLRYRLGDEGEPYRVIEAIGEGVVLNTLSRVAGDYAAALRPNLGKRAKAQAIVAAFESMGKPYDFDFDFATDHALVCTELVWRSYRPAEGKEGLDIPLTRIAGRMTLPANDIVRYFDETADRPDAPLSFACFIDAIEAERRTFPGDEASLRASWRRPKWGEAR